MTNQIAAPQEISDTDLEIVKGGAETVHLYLQSNGEKIDGESTMTTHREVVVVGSKVKDVI